MHRFEAHAAVRVQTTGEPPCEVEGSTCRRAGRWRSLDVAERAEPAFVAFGQCVRRPRAVRRSPHLRDARAEPRDDVGMIGRDIPQLGRIRGKIKERMLHRDAE